MQMTGAIFDFDGTLFDTMSIWDSVGEKYLKNQGIQPHNDLRDVLRSLSLAQGADYLKHTYTLPYTESEIKAGILQIISDFYLHEAQPKTGAKTYLSRLQRSGVRMCIATATASHLVAAALKRCNMNCFFSAIFSCDEVGYGKDTPEIYELALTHLGTQKQDTFVFEDSYHAVCTAKKAGFSVVGVYDAHEPNNEGVCALADEYLMSFPLL